MGNRFHVLIVEDDPLVAEVLHATLVSDYSVSCANTVGEALAFLRTAHLDLVLVDSILPDGRGAQVVDFAESVGTAVIEMSGYPAEMTGFERSPRPHLGKPFGVDALLRIVDRVLTAKAGRNASADMP